MKLKELYKHRTDFTIIGLTGRTGSGCTQIARILSKDIKNLKKGLRNNNEFDDLIFKRKREICINYMSYNNNWQKFDIISYEKVLLFYLFKKFGNNISQYDKLIEKYFETGIIQRNLIIKKINILLIEYNTTLKEIEEIEDLSQTRNENDLLKINNIFFGIKFNFFSSKILKLLEDVDFYKKEFLIHKLACSIRKSGDFLNNEITNSGNVYIIAELINTIIKSRKKSNDSKENNAPTKIVVDSLKNSLEIIFFKERYSAFYMLALKDIIGNTRKRLEYKYRLLPSNRESLIDKLIKLDDEEYKTKQFSQGVFTSPDIENCIQKSDFHIFNLKKGEIEDFIKTFNKINELSVQETSKILNTFLTREEQLIKLISLINQPGIITPSASERNMQIAYTAKLNSGCISRQVGAVITDNHFIAKSIGWNDVAKGHTPCNLRSVDDFMKDDLINNPHYSEFEKGSTNNAVFKYKKNKVNTFNNAIVDYFGEKLQKNKSELNGKNCSFCFKTIHNYYEGDSNQVHTRSLHAEENAMLQLTKFGGLGVNKGFLFTTASPCELCSKKAYQLGIRIIFYIDPYPGIAINQIISGGNNQPLLIPFSGAIGNSYHKLYEPYLSAKDEITMSLELNDKNTNINQFKNILKSVYPKYNEEDLDKIKTINDVQTIIDQGLGQFKFDKEEEDK